MSNRISGSLTALTMAALIAAAGSYITAQEGTGNPGTPRRMPSKSRSGCPQDIGLAFHQCAQEKMKTFKPALTKDGQPDFRGYWSRPLLINTIEEIGRNTVDEPRGSNTRRASLIVDPVDGKIPYQPWARRQAVWNEDVYIDPQSSCYLPGPARLPYNSPGGYLISQPPGDRAVVMLIERLHMYRYIPTDGRPHLPSTIKLFEGDPVGRWEGNTLVIDITNLNGETWFDAAGNFLSSAAHIVERWTMIDPQVVHVETTIDDPKVFTRPMKMVVAWIRVKDPSHELLEDACWEGERDLQTMSKFTKRYPGWKRLPGPHATSHEATAEP